jgi:hypothetical protein
VWFNSMHKHQLQPCIQGLPAACVTQGAVCKASEEAAVLDHSASRLSKRVLVKQMAG